MSSFCVYRTMCTMMAIAWIIASTAITAGCKSSAVQRTESGDAGEPLGMQPLQASFVLAKVGDKNITLGDYAATLERMDRFDRLRYKTPQRRRELLNEMITVELLAQEAERRGLDKDPQAQQALREVLRDAILADARAKGKEPIAFSEQEVRAYFDAHRNDFSQPERRRVSHLQVGSEKLAQDLLNKAQKITDQEAWGNFVVQHCETFTGKKPQVPVEMAGDLGFVGPAGDESSANDKVAEAWREPIFQVEKVGQMVPMVLKSKDGKFHLVRVDAIHPAHSRSFEEAQRIIRILLSQQDVARHEAQLEKDLREKYPISINENALKDAKIIELKQMPELLEPLPGKQPPMLPKASGLHHEHDHHHH